MLRLRTRASRAFNWQDLVPAPLSSKSKSNLRLPPFSTNVPPKQPRTGGLKHFANRGSGGWGNGGGSSGFFRKNELWKYRWIVSGVGALAFTAYCTEKVPVTNRWTVRLVSQRMEEKFGKREFDQIVATATKAGKILPANDRHTQAVRRVGKRIVQSSGIDKLQRMEWEFVVIDSAEPNAFVLPGGKVCVFTGILPLMKDETGMATVLSHEIGHVVARHAAEKIASALWVIALSLVGFPGFVVIANSVLINGLYSQKLESEADQIGIHLMARACYDPAKAAELWVRMAAFERDMLRRMGGKAPNIRPFASSHPPHAKREEQLRNWSPAARSDFDRANCQEKLDAYRREIEQLRSRHVRGSGHLPRGPEEPFEKWL